MVQCSGFRVQDSACTAGSPRARRSAAAAITDGGSADPSMRTFMVVSVCLRERVGVCEIERVCV
jgi:hypothetical protein